MIIFTGEINKKYEECYHRIQEPEHTRTHAVLDTGNQVSFSGEPT